ncbi:MAG: NAD(P)-binding domain-containing protein [Myxococcales bacterium]|nr:NAD(P)-binding domain-containing protein [Myxococcales bacterium]
MKIGVLGAGKVGGTLGHALARVGHDIVYAARDPDDPRHAALRHARAQVASIATFAAQVDAVILATPWGATEAALASAGDLRGLPLLDVTNPLTADLQLTHGHTDSGAEQVARWAPSARVVKVFNTTGLENMADPVYPDGRAAMFVCGDDPAACELALGLARDLGFAALFIGELARARILEPVAALWINLALVLGHGRNIAFGLLQREGP